MAGEEAGSKLVRFFYFVGIGVVCTKAINLWREYEHKQAIAEAAEKLNGKPQTPADTANEAHVKSFGGKRHWAQRQEQRVEDVS